MSENEIINFFKENGAKKDIFITHSVIYTTGEIVGNDFFIKQNDIRTISISNIKWFIDKFVNLPNVDTYIYAIQDFSPDMKYIRYGHHISDKLKHRRMVLDRIKEKLNNTD